MCRCWTIRRWWWMTSWRNWSAQRARKGVPMKAAMKTAALSVKRPKRRRSMKRMAILAAIANNFKPWLNIRLFDWMTLVFSSLDGESQRSNIVNRCFCRSPNSVRRNGCIDKIEPILWISRAKVWWTRSRSEHPSLRSNGLKRRHEQDCSHRPSTSSFSFGLPCTYSFLAHLLGTEMTKENFSNHESPKRRPSYTMMNATRILLKCQNKYYPSIVHRRESFALTLALRDDCSFWKRESNNADHPSRDLMKGDQRASDSWKPRLRRFCDEKVTE